VFQGESDVAQELLKLPFDHIFFHGGKSSEGNRDEKRGGKPDCQWLGIGRKIFHVNNKIKRDANSEGYCEKTGILIYQICDQTLV